MAGAADKNTLMAEINTLRHLAAQGAIKQTIIRPLGGKWAVWMQAPEANYILATTRNKPRLFTTLETAAKTVRDIGIGGVWIALDEWHPNEKGLAGV